MSEFQSWRQPIQITPPWDPTSTRTIRATADQLKLILYGIKSTAHWPLTGLPKVMKDGIILWLEPAGWGKQSRLMCNCPHEDCEKELSYGRLHQHLRVHHVHS